jgi:hypothetical protein
MWINVVFVQSLSQHKSKSVAELERTVVAMKRVVEKLQKENKRLLSGRKDAVTEHNRVIVSLPQCRDFKYNLTKVAVKSLYSKDQLTLYNIFM